jgi:hypothetical protein
MTCYVNPEPGDTATRFFAAGMTARIHFTEDFMLIGLLAQRKDGLLIEIPREPLPPRVLNEVVDALDRLVKPVSLLREDDDVQLSDDPDSYFNSPLWFSAATNLLVIFARNSLSPENCALVKAQIEGELDAGSDTNFITVGL